MDVIYSETCFCGENKLKYQSTCADCVNKLPPHIKFELWRPMADGFIEVYKDAIKFITNLGVEVETINFNKENSMVY